MTALNQHSGVQRTRAVADAFIEVFAANGGRAVVRYKEGRTGPVKTVEVFLVGLGWNVTYSGTQEALIVRPPKALQLLEMIPYPWLISIDKPS